MDRRDRIFEAIEELVYELTEEDEPPDITGQEIVEAIEHGHVTIEEIVDKFRAELLEAIRLQSG
jgi:hypothetical protein